jgi:hypothetical protein
MCDVKSIIGFNHAISIEPGAPCAGVQSEPLEVHLRVSVPVPQGPGAPLRERPMVRTLVDAVSVRATDLSAISWALRPKPQN